MSAKRKQATKARKAAERSALAERYTERLPEVPALLSKLYPTAAPEQIDRAFAAFAEIEAFDLKPAPKDALRAVQLAEKLCAGDGRLIAALIRLLPKKAEEECAALEALPDALPILAERYAMLRNAPTKRAARSKAENKLCKKFQFNRPRENTGPRNIAKYAAAAFFILTEQPPTTSSCKGEYVWFLGKLYELFDIEANTRKCAAVAVKRWRAPAP
jgi:hypothetical protein